MLKNGPMSAAQISAQLGERPSPQSQQNLCKISHDQKANELITLICPIYRFSDQPSDNALDSIAADFLVCIGFHVIDDAA